MKRIPDMKQRRLLALTALAALLAACGSLQPASNFQPPEGWAGTPALFGRVQAWRNGSQTVMLVKGDAQHSDVFYNPQLSQSAMRSVRHETIKVCGNRTAQYYRGVKTNGSVIEAVMVPGSGDTRWVAMYVRNEPNTPADPQAEHSLKTLCPAA
jgi:hypothetical protein